MKLSVCRTSLAAFLAAALSHRRLESRRTALVWSWARGEGETLDSLLWPIAQVFRNSHKFWIGRIKQAPEFATVMREHIAARFDWLDGELANRQYFAGERFSVADITAMCALDFGKVVDIRIQAATHPNLKAWHQRVATRPRRSP